MGLRKDGASLGQSDQAWTFFTHPYQVFDPAGGFYNHPTESGILSATLVGRYRTGIVLYDEVGTIAKERVSDSYFGALGNMRDRLFARTGPKANPRHLEAFMALDLRLLRTFRALTLLLKSQSPKLVFRELGSLFQNRTVARFFGEEFTKTELALFTQDADTLSHDEQLKFAINDDDFMRAHLLTDGGGNQVVAGLLGKWEEFQNVHGPLLEVIGEKQALLNKEKKDLTARIHQERERQEAMSSLGRFMSGRVSSVRNLEKRYVVIEQELAELEQKVAQVPGYQEMHMLTERIRSFKQIVAGVRRLAINVFDYNVGLQHIKELEELHRRIMEDEEGEEQRKNLSRYHMRIRADIVPRMLQVFTISAYVLRRPDALVGFGSAGNMGRINKMAEKLIEYFRYVPYIYNRGLGEHFDEGWGQVRMLEARI